jgi:hypothetical protein
MGGAKFCHPLKEDRQVDLAGFPIGHQPRHRLFVFRDGDFFTLPDALQEF